jgi:23S rRNA pseudouridine1911/1915/1917 synthase
VSEPRKYEVAASEAGERLDKFLVQHVPELGRRGARWLIERAFVLVAGRPAPKSRRLQPGEIVLVLAEFNGAPEAEPDALLDVRLVRSDLVVVDKPAGQASAPLVADERGTLAGALLGRYPEMAGIGYRSREPGLLHRLDTRTSGLVIAARQAEAFERLRVALVEHRLDKRYLAIVDAPGLPQAGVIDRALMPRGGGSGRVVVAPDVRAEGAQPCQSTFRTLERRGRWALLEVVAPRAYRHQVRVHLASSGWPIAGDQEYGGAVANALEHRHALHASHVAWAGDDRVPAFAVDSVLPEDLAAFFRDGEAASGSRIATSSS